jgi:hypothetical protein
VRNEELSCTALSTVTRLPERVVDFLGEGAMQQFLHTREHAERGGVPPAIEPAGASISAPPSTSASATSTSSLLAAQWSGVSCTPNPLAPPFGSAASAPFYLHVGETWIFGQQAFERRKITGVDGRSTGNGKRIVSAHEIAVSGQIELVFHAKMPPAESQ